ncbi:MAG: metallophosphoesterase [Lentisphaeria bacterium]|nr:metallophosphoesterase [Lentisphaeria bacterium]
MKLSNLRIEIGLPGPVRLLHLSDTHLAFADERDDIRKRELAISRSKAFAEHGTDLLRHLEEAAGHARANRELIVHTGDLIDFVSHRNLDCAGEFFSKVDCFAAAGNHEFSKYVGEAWEDEAYKLDSLPLVRSRYPNDLRFASRLVGGVNLVAVDNSYYLFREQELELLKQEAARGYPIVLLLHNPIHTDDLYHEMMVNRGRECAYLVGTPEKLLKPYSGHRRRQQQPDDATIAFIDYLEHEPLVKAILAGHLHFNYHTRLFGRIGQHIVGGGYFDLACAVELV